MDIFKSRIVSMNTIAASHLVLRGAWVPATTSLNICGADHPRVAGDRAIKMDAMRRKSQPKDAVLGRWRCSPVRFAHFQTRVFTLDCAALLWWMSASKK